MINTLPNKGLNRNNGENFLLVDLQYARGKCEIRYTFYFLQLIFQDFQKAEDVSKTSILFFGLCEFLGRKNVKRNQRIKVFLKQITKELEISE